MNGPSSEDGPSLFGSSSAGTDGRPAPRALSLLALGGCLLAGFALIGATGTLMIALLGPTPLLLALPFLFGPLALAGGVLGFVGRRRAGRARAPRAPSSEETGALHRDPAQVGANEAAAPRTGRTLGLVAVVFAAITLFGVLPVAISLGYPRFRAFQLESREQQALDFMTQIRMGAMSHQHEGRDGRFPAGDTGFVPAAQPTSGRYPYDAALWKQEPWTSLDFAPSAAHFHQYRYHSIENGRGFVVQARGDLDGDGRLATYTLTVRVEPDGQVIREGPVRDPDDAR